MDIIKLMLLSRQMKNRRHEKNNMVTGIPPLTFTANKTGLLKNYRIYGDTVNGESVGDRTGNILPMSTTPIDTIIDDFHCEYDGMGTIKLTALTDNAVLSGFTVPLSKSFTLPRGIDEGGTSSVQLNNSKAYLNSSNVASLNINFTLDRRMIAFLRLSVLNRVFNAMPVVYIDAIQIATEAPDGGLTRIPADQTITIQPAVVENESEQVPFEPYVYKVPVTVSNGTDTLTTPIYLPEQIKKVGDEAEYIDFEEQKQHRVRKNLLNTSANTKVVNGIRFTVNSDKSITIAGNLAASRADFTLYAANSPILNRGEYSVSCENASANTYFIIGGSSSTGHVPYKEIANSNSVKVSCSGGSIGYCIIRVISNIGNPITLYPMIRLASIEDDTYEPYIETTELDVTLPALPTLKRTNTLSVGTEVQPSKIEVVGRVKMSGGD